MTSADDILDQFGTALADRTVSFDAMRCIPEAPRNTSPALVMPAPSSVSIQGPDGEWHDISDCVTSITVNLHP